MSHKLQGKVALVIGSGRGIGRAIALKLAGEGARLVVNDLDELAAQETVQAIRAIGGQAEVCLGTRAQCEIVSPSRTTSAASKSKSASVLR